MHGCGVKPLHVVKGDRRIDEESEQSGPHKVPKSNGDKIVNRPLVRRHPGTGTGKGQILIRFEADQYQRNHLQRAESGAECQNPDRRSAEVQVVERTDNPSEQKDDRGKKNRSGGCGYPQQSHTREQERDHRLQILQKTLPPTGAPPTNASTRQWPDAYAVPT